MTKYRNTAIVAAMFTLALTCIGTTPVHATSVEYGGHLLGSKAPGNYLFIIVAFKPGRLPHQPERIALPMQVDGGQVFIEMILTEPKSRGGEYSGIIRLADKTVTIHIPKLDERFDLVVFNSESRCVPLKTWYEERTRGESIEIYLGPEANRPNDRTHLVGELATYQEMLKWLYF